MRKIEYFKMQEKKQKLFDRKADARKKIQLGGLFIKAGFGDMHPHEAYVLYGMLRDCIRALRLKPELRDRWKEMGKELLVID